MKHMGKFLRVTELTFVLGHLLVQPTNATINITIAEGQQSKHIHTHLTNCAHHNIRNYAYQHSVNRSVNRYGQHRKQYPCHSIKRIIYGHFGEPTIFSKMICYSDCSQAHAAPERKYLTH